MKAMLSPLKELDAFLQAEKVLKKEKQSVHVTGCVDSQKWNFAFGLCDSYKNRIIVTYSDSRVREIYEDFRMYDKNVRMYPAKDVIFYQADVHGNKLVKDRLMCVKRALMGLPCTFITTFGGLMNVTADIETIRQNILSVSVGATISENEITKKLLSLGYEKTHQVETNGQFAVRGGIVDVFDLTEENPYRIELWGDEITSIRSFDVESQRSVDRLENIRIFPASELPLSENNLLAGLDLMKKDAKKLITSFREKTMPEEAHRLELLMESVTEEILQFPWTFNADSYIHYFAKDKTSLCDYFEDCVIILDEPARIKEHADAVELEFKESMKMRLEKGYILPGQSDVLLTKDEVIGKIKEHRVLLLSTMDGRMSLMKPDLKVSVNAKSIPSYNNDFAGLIKDLNTYKKKKYRIIILSGSRTRAKRLSFDLNDNDVIAFYTEDTFRELAPGEIMTSYGRVTRGFEYPDIKLVVVSETDIFGGEKKKKKVKKKYEGSKVLDFNELHFGDYVVHERHGIGIYRGIEKVESEGVIKDYMKIEYKDGGALYIPATSADVIMKYSSSDARKPKINKLGSVEWSKTTSKVKSAVAEVATELVNLYAKRQFSSGYQYSIDTPWQREFEEMFPYEETSDQLDAIEATKKDMESRKIMDRLICGDVGFGKTEVAIRAAFKAVQDSKQVVFLVPTTILAQQHYSTFTQRMKDFPVRVELLSRFVSKANQAKTIKDLKDGSVDIVIGTHRLLSKEIQYKDLGLLIIDEEQRFGVSHKEKIKSIKENVDVLTLTATPIPRTLHMSLSGIRDMSLLEEAPNDRLPIQTYVMEYNEEMVREAITRELSRKGQVYYVYNRVNNIADIASNLQNIVPEANVAYAHGQMKESELEEVMYDFIKGDIDVLVATTIIETGIDIPNVNTMIIHDSEDMGLSQLYQLRGRVGRSQRTAYAFLMYRRDKMLKEVAEKRLQTIRDFTDLGSGFKIAMRDMEIRGAGNVLGMSQSGHMSTVGYDLYCKMLNKAVRKQKGLEVEEQEVDCTIDLDVDAFIPSDYISNELMKLDTYKKIASLENEAEKADMQDELKDRYGKVPDSVENLLSIATMRMKAKKIGISEVRGLKGEIRFTFLANADINVDNIPTLLNLYGGKLKPTLKGNPVFTYKYYPTGEVLLDERTLLEHTGHIIDDMYSLLKKF